MLSLDLPTEPYWLDLPRAASPRSASWIPTSCVEFAVR
jgi:hypothetical protein